MVISISIIRILTIKYPPDWVGRFENNIDYREYLRSKGLELPLIAGGTSVVDDAGDELVDDEVENKAPAEEEIPEGIAIASTTVASGSQPQAVIDTHKQLSMNSNEQQPSTTIDKPPSATTENPPSTAIDKSSSAVIDKSSTAVTDNHRQACNTEHKVAKLPEEMKRDCP